MKKLFIILLAFSAAACSKVSNHNSQSHSPDPFFKNPDEVTVLVKKTIQKLGLDGEFKSIERVSYLYSGKAAFMQQPFSTFSWKMSSWRRKNNTTT